MLTRQSSRSILLLFQRDGVGCLALFLTDHVGVQLCVVGVTISLYLCSAVARVAIPLSVVDRHKDYG